MPLRYGRTKWLSSGMSLRFASLGSGSRGNATLIHCDSTYILLDCGFSAVQVERRLQRLGVEPEQLAAILITHEHSDHIGSAERFSRKHDIPVWLTQGTHEACGYPAFSEEHLFHAHDTFSIGDLQVQPFPVPHDAREPCQFVFEDGQWRLGILTDTGSITPHIRTSLAGCHALLMECNYDPVMMANGPYPPALKSRITGDYGHLANEQAQTLLQQLDLANLQHIVGVHISEKNNHPDLAAQALCAGVGCERDWIRIAEQDTGFDWRELR